MNILAKMFGGSYDDLWKAVIRPPRDLYTDKELGPDKFSIKGKNYKRTDFYLVNNRNLKLQCSFWEPYDEEREYDRLPCVVYLHGNSSSRCEAVTEVKFLLPMNVTLFAFDFAGCGRSEGEYISLGWYEREDVEYVIEFLRKSNKVSTIGLWGRSMGAVTAIMYGDRDPSIAGMVIDSAFSSLKVLIEELVKDKVSLPGFILNQAVKLVKSTVTKKAKFNLDDIEPIKFAERCFIPALFIHASNDVFVQPHHSKELHAVYPGDKNLIFVEGDHNSIRPRFFKDSTAIFFYNTLQVQHIKEISDNYAGFKIILKKEEVHEGTNANVNNNNNNNQGMIVEHPNPDVNDMEYLNDKLDNFNVEDDEEEIFKKILEMSKKEFEGQIVTELKQESNMRGVSNSNNNNNNNNNNNESEPMQKSDVGLIINIPPDKDCFEIDDNK